MLQKSLDHPPQVYPSEAKMARKTKKSALNCIRASIQPIGDDPDLLDFLCKLKERNAVDAVIALYDAFVDAANAYQAIDNQPRSRLADDCLAAHSEQAWAKAYLCADLLKDMRPTRYNIGRYGETLFRAALAMGNTFADAAKVVKELAEIEVAPLSEMSR